MEIYTGKGLEKNIKLLGLNVDFLDKKVTPFSVVYRFELYNPLDYKKVKNIIKALSVAIYEEVKVTRGRKCSFCLEFTRPERLFINFKNYCHVLQDKNPSSVLLGLDEDNEMLTYELDKMPHMLVAGATGSGKSVFLNNIIMSICCFSENVGLVLIDPKQVEFSQFENSNKLVMPIAITTRDSISSLNTLCHEMDRRFSILKDKKLRDNSSNVFNKIVVVIDELADLMLTSKKEVENYIVRLAQKGRAAGIHLIVATQRPTVNVVTGLIKANIPMRVAFAMASVRDSVVLLDHKGAEKLKGRGDALVKLPDQIEEIRIQAPFVDEQTIKDSMPENARVWDNNVQIPHKRKRRMPKLQIHKLDCSSIKNFTKSAISIGSEEAFSTNELNYYDCIFDD